MIAARGPTRAARPTARALAALACAAAAGAGWASIQEDPFDPPDSRELPSAADEPKPPALSDSLRREFVENLDQLDHESWPARESATRWFTRTDIPREVIEEVLDSGALSHEQRHRLIGALHSRIVNATPGAIGIRMGNPEPGTLGVRVEGIFSGMPAEKVLKRNDRVTHVNDQAVYSTDMFQEAVSDLRPGETVWLRLQRPRERDAEAPGGGDVPELLQPEEFDTIDVEIPVVDATPLGASHLEGVMADRQRRASLLIALRAPRPVMLRVPSAESAADADPRVSLLKSQLEAIRDNRLGVTPELLQSWRETKLELQRAASEPNLSVADRIARRQVFDRYAELLAPTGL